MTAGYRTDVEQEQDLLPQDMYPTYRVMELAEADLQIQAWAKPLIQNSQGQSFNTALNGKTYLLIKNIAERNRFGGDGKRCPLGVLLLQ
ncbi:hypothetical protein [Brevibacillus brevis]|uniref:hypothetical protein n=1 Tax=Brevibacillus brevis TaxID=1393 RepID=UPI0025A4F99A|nr:hypothetical protein [Brevibacillus brevis]WJQ80664.1 hypothetical protein QN310_24900 [Brevibacillus brevis]